MSSLLERGLEGETKKIHQSELIVKLLVAWIRKHLGRGVEVYAKTYDCYP